MRFIIKMMAEKTIDDFIKGRSAHTLELYNHFIKSFKNIGDITLYPAKTMIGISNRHKRVAWITAFGKNFLHVVFPFKQPCYDNLCFQKIAQVPGANQFNHHFRMLLTDDVNEELEDFMKMARQGGN